MTQRFFEKQLSLIAVGLVLAIALGCYAVYGAAVLSAVKTITVAHGPSIPPDPWGPPDGSSRTLVAHGPSIPPDPWGPPDGSSRTLA